MLAWTVRLSLAAQRSSPIRLNSTILDDTEAFHKNRYKSHYHNSSWTNNLPRKTCISRRDLWIKAIEDEGSNWCYLLLSHCIAFCACVVIIDYHLVNLLALSSPSLPSKLVLRQIHATESDLRWSFACYRSSACVNLNSNSPMPPFTISLYFVNKHFLNKFNFDFPHTPHVLKIISERKWNGNCSNEVECKSLLKRN